MDQTGRTRAASVARVLCFGVLMTVLVAAELYLHYKTIPVFLDYLLLGAPLLIILLIRANKKEGL